ncbi:MAG TPA: ABC transporter ATP-binding protein [Chloroflexi bacterium]|jgi:NitT/TauT family transport system ATP-binding protein|nr:ABC transporter ATP-binding protein [Chloroflexota bacterium]
MNSSPELSLQVNDLTVTFPEKDGCLSVLENISFSLQKNAFVCLIGPSGSGKSTLLRTLAGLIPYQSGRIEFPDIQGRQAKTGLVFQKPNLMPWRNLTQNIALPLELNGTPQPEIDQKTKEMIDLTGLHGFEESWPHELSGGMAQRVAIARSLVQDPDILLLDEPFGSLDELTRERMSEELLRIWNEERKTILMVTHSIPEAVYLSDRVLVLSSSPAGIVLDLPIELPRPRDSQLRYSPEFARAAALLHEHLKF